jgi:hypothetical protein
LCQLTFSTRFVCRLLGPEVQVRQQRLDLVNRFKRLSYLSSNEPRRNTSCCFLKPFRGIENYIPDQFGASFLEAVLLKTLLVNKVYYFSKMVVFFIGCRFSDVSLEELSTWRV